MATIAETLAQAKARLLAGDLSGAEPLYRLVLASDAANAEAHHDLGLVHAGLGRLDEAVACFQNALQLQPDSAEVSTNLQRALGLKQYGLGNALVGQGKLVEAVACYRRALERKLDTADLHHNLGVVLARLEKADEAEACLRRALALRPEFAEAHNNLGGVLTQQGRLDEATACLRRALELQPEHAGAYYNLADVALRRNQPDDAIACLRRAVELKPDYADAYYNLARLAAEQRKPDEAVAGFRRAIELKPDYAEAYNNLGFVLRDQHRQEEAVAFFRRALELKPDFAEAQSNCALALIDQNKLDEAEACLRRAIELQPDFADAHVNLACTLLLKGRLTEGWVEQEWRWQRKGVEQATCPQPRWTGSPLHGKTILLRHEQGFGDTLQFIRYAELVKQRGGRVIAECQAPLVSLLATCRGVDSAIAMGSALPPFDFHVPLLSLPAIFGTSLDNVPAKVPYLWPADELVERWRAELGAERGLRIGIVWQGNRDYPQDHVRSFPVTRFAPLIRMSGVRCFGLQMGPARDQLRQFDEGASVIDLGDRLGDFHNMAAIVRSLDLVISCDSAPAHLAGALGVPVWLPLAFAPHWPWMLEREDTPWYPTMRLFRQTQPGEWDKVFQRMHDELAEWVAADAH